MSYLVLARRFRPQTFASIVGQEHISRALANALLRDKVAHALLFTGPRGVGKTTTARVLSRALNCTGRDLETARKLPEDQGREYVEPCGECPNCVEIAKGSSLACREIDGASNNSVESMREVIESLRTLPPPGSRFKIYLIDEVHMLSTSAFNALLKSLEEPPPNTIFIFATTDPQKIPETVISRCQQFDFRRLPFEIVVSSLKKIVDSEGVEVDDRVLALIAKRAQGGMRDAQSALDRLLAFSEKQISLSFAEEVFGLAGSAALLKLLTAVLSGESQEAHLVLQKLFEKSLDVRGFVSDFISFFRLLYLLKIQAVGQQEDGGLDADTLKELSRLAQVAEPFDLQRLFQLSQEIGDRALQSNYPRYALEAGVARMCLLPSLKPLAEVLSAKDDGIITTLKKQAPKSVTHASASESVSAGTSQFKPHNPSQFKEREVEEREPAHQDSSSFSPSVGFNPSWVDFVSAVSKQKNILLGQFLKRVSARKFVDGVLEIEGTEFDIGSLKDPAMQETLKRSLQNYSPGRQWSLAFFELKGATPSSKSLQAQEEDKRRISREQIVREAQEDPLVKSALQTFGGKIVGVSPLKE